MITSPFKSTLAVLFSIFVAMPTSLSANSKVLDFDSTWNQTTLYQKFTPRTSDGKETYAGCVNIALGQIMRYQHLKQSDNTTWGKGFATTNWGGTTLEAITNRPYNWTNMPTVLDSNTPDYQVDEVARFIRDLAIANKTEFGVDGSGANLNIASIYKNFGYSQDVGYIDLTPTTKEVFLEKIAQEIEAGRPVFLAIPGKKVIDVNGNPTYYGGHAVVVYGYDYSDLEHKKLKINFGWGGSSDNFYQIGDSLPLNLDFSGENWGDNNTLTAYYNITPCSSSVGNCYIDSDWEGGDGDSNSILTGAIINWSDEDTYTMYLSSDTSFEINQLKSTYGNLALYINLYNKDGVLMTSTKSDNKIIYTALKADKYYVNISANDHATGFSYPVKSDGTKYVLGVSTTQPTDARVAEIEQEILNIPTISNDFAPLVLKIGEPYKVLIDAANEVDQTTIYSVSGDNTVATTQLDGNILTITPLKAGATNIKIKAFANAKESVKTLPVIVANEKISVGKEIVLSGKVPKPISGEYNLEQLAFKAYLSGSCTIKSDAVYIGVNDNLGANQLISSVFSGGVYSINAAQAVSISTQEGISTNWIVYDSSNDNFTINISCPNADVSTSSILSALNISSPTLDSTSTTTLTNGWNMASLPSSDKISITQFFANNPKVTIVWQYQNGSWLASSSDSSISSALQSAHFSPIKYIESTNGYWFKVSKSDGITLASDGKTTSNNLDIVLALPSGSKWNLLSAQKGIVPSDVFGVNSNISLIWQYQNGNWYLATRDSNANTWANELQTIKAGSAYWVY